MSSGRSRPLDARTSPPTCSARSRPSTSPSSSATSSPASAAKERFAGLRAAVEVLPEAVERHEPPPATARAPDEGGSRRRRAAAAAARAAESGARGWLGRLLHGSGTHGWRPLAGVVALALVVVALGGYEIGNGGESGGGGTNTFVSGKAPGVTAEVVRKSDSSAELRMANVGELPEGRVLEAWVQRDGEVEPVPALFVPDKRGKASTTIARPQRGRSGAGHPRAHRRQRSADLDPDSEGPDSRVGGLTPKGEAGQRP